MVSITRLLLARPPVLMLEIGFVPMKLQDPGFGSPELQLREMALGIGPIAPTTTWNVAGTPATTVAVAGDTARVKSFTLADGGAAGLKVWLLPKTLTVPLSLNVPAEFGVMFTVTRAEVFGASDPTAHVTVTVPEPPPVPALTTLLHPPGAVAEANVGFELPNISVKLIPETKSFPLLVIV